MAHHLDIAALAKHLRARGLTVHVEPGAQGRTVPGSYSRSRPPTSVVVHHTAGPSRANARGDYPSMRVVRDGRADVPGPLSQIGLGFSGAVYLVASGYAHHAGKVADKRWSSAHAIGIEAENPGDGSGWSAEQYRAYVRLVAGLCELYDIDPDEVRGHKEVAAPAGRKVDPTFDMVEFRRAVTAQLRGSSRPAPSPSPTAPQAALSLTPDGYLGPRSMEVLRRLVRASSDRSATRYVQARLNSSGWSRAVLGRDLVVDGYGLENNAVSRVVSRTMTVLFAALDEDASDRESTATGYYRFQWYLERGRLWNYAHLPPKGQVGVVAPPKAKPGRSLPLAPRSAAQAIDWADERRPGYGGLCLKFVRVAYGIPSKFGGARLAWQGATVRHPQSSVKGIPVGAPIFLDRPGSVWGHVAIYLGGGRMATTDSHLGITQVDDIKEWTHGPFKWRLLGWTEDLNGYRITL